ncbi:MAG TPA: hypothetical protein VE776_02570 [Actinomycetota bacterium]|jgi:hypothetical protein|nr:hypothetical protein [Actinomycetota bacterium]
MHFSANESIARQHIAELRAQAEHRRRLRARQLSPRRRLRRDVREALGYRLVVLGWRLLDTNPHLAHRPATR